MSYLHTRVIHVVYDAWIVASCYADALYDGQKRCAMSEAQRERSGARRRRSLRWMEALWEGATTSAQEENRKEEVL